MWPHSLNIKWVNLQTLQMYAKCGFAMQPDLHSSAWAYLKNIPSAYSLRHSSLGGVVRNVPNPNQVKIKTEKQNYYQLLGIRKDATLRDIKNAYYDLAKQYHPDASKVDGSEAHIKFQCISEAYEALSDQSKRYEYDRYGFVKLKKVRKSLGNDTRRADSSTPIKSDIKSREVKNEEEEEEVVVPISFMQSVHGAKREIIVPCKIMCKQCRNQTISSHSRALVCPYCNGSGTQSMPGQITKIKCRSCKGSRYALKQTCSDCGGRGYVVTKTRMTIPIPSGTADKQIIRLINPSNNQCVKVRVHVEPNEQFRRDDFDIHNEMQIPFGMAVLGGDIKVTTIHGECTITIPAGIDSHSRIRVPGKGIKRSTFGVGDHIVTVKVKTPTNLTKHQRSLVLAFLESFTEKICLKPTFKSNTTYDYQKELKKTSPFKYIMKNFKSFQNGLK